MEIISKKLSISYEQEEDCDGRSTHSEQYLNVETCDGGGSGREAYGGGEYFVISTERWAIIDRDEAHKMIDRICDDLLIDKIHATQSD